VDEDLRALPEAVPVSIVLNKADLGGSGQGGGGERRATQAGVGDTIVSGALDTELAAERSMKPTGAVRSVLRISALTGEGMDRLREHLKSAAGYEPAEAGSFSARRRHLDALARVHAHVTLAREHLRARAGAELVAEELRLGQAALGEILGEFTSEDLLGKIFSSFCIGK
jgi:tRNA modification GTPase